MTQFSLAAVLLLSGLSAQARPVEITCKPNPGATSAQFMMVANLVVEEDNTISGVVKYATRDTATAQTSDVRTITVDGTLTVIPGGDIATHSVSTYKLVDESNELVRIILNPDLKGKHSSTLLIDRKFRYSSQCREVTKH